MEAGIRNSSFVVKEYNWVALRINNIAFEITGRARRFSSDCLHLRQRIVSEINLKGEKIIEI
jgi:hypothetical protein